VPRSKGRGSAGREYNARLRGKELEKGESASTEVVRLSPLPCWQHLAEEDYRARIREIVREINESAAAARAESLIAPLGGGLSDDLFAALCEAGIPVVEEPLPVVELPVPLVAEPLPIGNLGIPVVEESLPVVELPIPLVAEPLPIVELLIPVVSERLPIVELAVTGPWLSPAFFGKFAAE